ncbi:MAG: CRTAC1 family protein [Myxococcota bacterium]
MIFLLLSCNTENLDKEPISHFECADPLTKAGTRFSTDLTRFGELSNQSASGYASDPSQSIYNYAGGGIMVADFNGDGWDDIYLATLDLDEFYLGSANGFTTANQWIPDNLPALSVGGVAADYDGDGDFDLLVAHAEASDRLLRNDGTYFTDVSESAGLTQYAYDTSGATFGDVDLDGDLDLILVSHREASFDTDDPNDADGIVFPEPHPPQLYLNNGNGQFTEITDAFEIDPLPYSFSAILLPQEGTPPLLYFVNDFGPEWMPNLMFEWNGSGYTMIEGPTSLQIALYGMGADITDFNYDQEPDIFMSSWCNPAMLLSDSDNSWYHAEQAYGFTKCDERHLFSWSPAAEDFDNDGDLDVWLSYGPFPIDTLEGTNYMHEQPDAFFINNRQGLIYVSDIWEIEDTASARGGVMVDLDQDGNLDIIRAAVNAPTEIYWGQCSNGNWIEIELSQAGLNRFGIGSKVSVITAEQTYTDWIFAGGEATGSSKPPRVHFGLGSSTKIQTVVVTWPDGSVETYSPSQLNARIQITR